MAGSRLPVVISHGEGQASFRNEADAAQAVAALRYVDHRGAVTEAYPFNPNGSPQGLAGLTTADGRFTVMMPHPERSLRSLQLSWVPSAMMNESPDATPWLRMFANARVWLG